MDIVGIIPAGGYASRLGKIPCSKEVFPVIDKNGNIQVTSSHLLNYFRLSGIRNVYIVIRKGKWDIPEYYGDGHDLGLNIGYLIMNLPYGTPFTIDQCYPFTTDKLVALGFPDIIIKPENAFAQLKMKMYDTHPDLLLGVVPSEEYLASDMIEFDNKGGIMDIVIKQNRPDLKYSWFGAIWSPAFSEFMHGYLKEFLDRNPDSLFKTDNNVSRELYLGDIFRDAIKSDLKISHLLFENGSYTDLGTPESVYKHLR